MSFVISSIQESKEDRKKRMGAQRLQKFRATLTQQEKQEINKKRRETRPKMSQKEK
jgi:hypothetical protein